MRCSFELLKLFVGVSLVAAITGGAWAQNPQATQTAPEKPTKEDPARRHAMELYSQGKFVDAMPIFETLVADHPSDVVLRERWAWCLFGYAATLSDPQRSKSVRARARKEAIEAKALGDNSQILQLLLELPEDGGSDSTFSNSKEVDNAMKAAEADFSRGELDKAREGYMRALLMDPNNYEASLFIGDVYFKQHVYGSAGEWFARAIQIDPNREAAYRYWGDALVALGKEDEARSKFIEGIIADPYTRRSWTGLQNWLQRNKLVLSNVRLKDRSSVTVKDDKSATLTLDSSLRNNEPDEQAWLSYGLDRAAWHTEALEKQFPDVPRDRHTLQEEAHALNFMVTVLKETKDYREKLPKLDPPLQAFIKIQEAGFTEPFVLFNRADAGIAQDYPAYRAANRDKIRRYLDEVMVPKTPSPTK